MFWLMGFWTKGGRSGDLKVPRGEVWEGLDVAVGLR